MTSKSGFSLEWKQGFAAFAAGKTLEDNPFPSGSAKAVEWADGFQAACDAELRG